MKKNKFVDVFISSIPSELIIEKVFPNDRDEDILSTTDEKLKKSKFWAWKLLEFAIYKTFALRLEEINVQKNKNGKWVSDKCFFSISHTSGLVVVAVGDKEVGVDVENLDVFSKRFSDGKHFEEFTNYILSDGEPSPKNILELAKLWTKKESAFKVSGGGFFSPRKVIVDDVKSNSIIVEFDKTEFMISSSFNDEMTIKYHICTNDFCSLPLKKYRVM